jgi:hypothetical protein
VNKMERKKTITRFAMVTTLVVLIFCLFPTVRAGTPPFLQELPNGNNLAFPFFINDYSWEFDSTEELYFRIGVARTIEEEENDWWPKPPWRFHLYINGEEIKLQRYAIPLDNNIFHPAVAHMCYALFEPDYFTPGEEYLLKFEFWVKNPYQGDGLNHWRPFVDYWGIYGDPGVEVLNIEYNLNIV